MEEGNDGASKRQYSNDQHQDTQDDTLTSSSKRFKLKADTAEDSLQLQEPLDNSGSNNGNSNAVDSHSHNGDLTLSVINGQASLTSRNQQDNIETAHHNKETPPQPQAPASSSSPFALHPILDELTNKPIYPSYEPPGMRMSMSAILTETGKGYHDRSSHSTNVDPGTVASSSSLSPSSTQPTSAMAQPSASRGQSLPPVNHFSHHHHHHPPSASERPTRHTASPSTEQPSQHHQQHHHRTSSHPNITSTLAQPLPTDEPVRKPEVLSLDVQQQRQSITNDQLVRALTTSIPMASDQSTQQQIVQTIEHQPQSTPAAANAPAPASPPPLALPSVPKVKQEESVPTTLASSSTTVDTYNSTLSPSQPDFGEALRRLSGATVFDQQHSSGKMEDVSPSEILGSALAAVARSQHHGTTAAAAAIGNLAAITANISHILNSNNNNNSDSANNKSLSPQSSSLPSRMATSAGITTTTAPPLSSLTITPSLEQQEQKKDGGNSNAGSDDRRQSTTSQPLHAGALSTMLDQAIQLGRTQQYQLQQDESSTGTRTDTIVNQETVDGMKRAAEAAASAAAAVAASVSTSATAPPLPTTAKATTTTPTTTTTTSPSTSSPVRLHNHNHLQHHDHRHPHHQQTSPSHYNPPSLLPPNQQQQQQHPHHYHHQHPYHYGQMLYSGSTGPTNSSLHAVSPVYPPHPPSVVQSPKVVINNDQVWKAMKGKKETNLGFYLYRPSMLLPNLQEHLNGIVQVRIPARYLSYQNPKVKKRAVWGTGIYTDDSDVVSMAIHSGKFIPSHHDPELESNDPFLLAVAGKNMDSIRAAARKQAMSAKTYLLGRHKDDTVPDYDINVTLRVLPKLQDYTSTIQHRVKSRHWGGNHDGVSFFVEKVEQLKKGEARPCGRSSLKSNLFRYESYRKQAPKLMTGTDSDGLPNNVI